MNGNNAFRLLSGENAFDRGPHLPLARQSSDGTDRVQVLHPLCFANLR